MKKIILFIAIPLIIASCGKNEKEYDATGSFEATETIISSEVAGQIKELNIQEGQELKAGQTIGYIDSTNVAFMKQQVKAQSRAIASRKPNIEPQLAAMKEQLSYLQTEKQRIQRLVEADAATRKQLDDMNNQIEIVKKQIAAQQSALDISTKSITGETVPLSVQVKNLDNQLTKYTITNPIAGTVLIKYAEANEITAPGKPLYKIADLSDMTMKAYVSGNQLGQIKIGQQVKVRIDAGEDKYKEYTGIIEKIANKAEFTPKTIQTKDERQNLVYSIKIKVKNDGYLKIGMYGEVVF